MRKGLSKSMLGSLGAVSSTTTYSTIFQPVDSFNSYMIQIVWSGSPTATVYLDISADPVPSLAYDAVLDSFPQPTNFDRTLLTGVSTSGVSIITFDISGSDNGSGANWVRLSWVNASGTGTITSINFVGKGAMV